MQNPSFWDFQRTMQETQGKINAQMLFGVFQIPTDNLIRSLLDAVEPAAVYSLFDFVFDGFQGAGVVDSFRAADHQLLLALDEAQYFSSQKLQGSCCSSKAHGNDKVSYSHTVVTPVLVNPGSNKVISLAPEFVRPQSVHEKTGLRDQCPPCAGWKAEVASTRHCSVMIYTVTYRFAERCSDKGLEFFLLFIPMNIFLFNYLNAGKKNIF